MAKYVYQELLDRQTKVTKIAGYAIVGFFALIYVLAKYLFGFEHALVNITAGFLVLTVINLLLLEWHKKVFVTYQLLIFLSYAIIVALAWYTGGLNSPAIFILTLCPVAAFSTSKKQGLIWSTITFCTIIAILINKHVPPSVITSEMQTSFSLFSIMFVLSLAILISYLVNRSTFDVHRAFNRDSKELKDKSLRLENLTTLLNYSNDLMCVVDLGTLTIDDLNPVFKLKLGYELSEVRGGELFTFVNEDDNTRRVISEIKLLKDNQVMEFSCNMKCKNGTNKIYKWVGIAKNGKMHASARESI
ncbi:MAG TPA: PAS domain S-box protein [Flavobacteriales bacterium]|nr:PAS domain S-box protein [Flavobacteriales bacterium]